LYLPKAVVLIFVQTKTRRCLQKKTAKTIFVQTSRLGLLIIGTQSALRMDLAFSNSAAGPIASTHKRELSCSQLLFSDHFFQHYFQQRRSSSHSSSNHQPCLKLNFAFDCIGDNRLEENQNPQTKDASVKTKKRVPSFSSFPIKPNRECKS
jgi:hypothetical protein